MDTTDLTVSGVQKLLLQLETHPQTELFRMHLSHICNFREDNVLIMYLYQSVCSQGGGVRSEHVWMGPCGRGGSDVVGVPSVHMIG